MEDKKPRLKREESGENAPADEKVVMIRLTDLHPFPNHPFKVREDESMNETVESVRDVGVLNPAIVRPRAEGGYEVISGHRRKRACELAGLESMPAIVRDMDDDTAVITMVDSNIQRENILPSERAQAYKMKMEAIKRRVGRRPKETPTENGKNGSQLGTHFSGKKSLDIIAEEAGVSRMGIFSTVDSFCPGCFSRWSASNKTIILGLVGAACKRAYKSFDAPPVPPNAIRPQDVPSPPASIILPR